MNIRIVSALAMFFMCNHLIAKDADAYKAYFDVAVARAKENELAWNRMNEYLAAVEKQGIEIAELKKKMGKKPSSPNKVTNSPTSRTKRPSQAHKQYYREALQGDENAGVGSE